MELSLGLVDVARAVLTRSTATTVHNVLNLLLIEALELFVRGDVIVSHPLDDPGIGLPAVVLDLKNRVKFVKARQKRCNYLITAHVNKTIGKVARC